MNTKIYLLLLLFFSTINLYAQDKTILVFDLLNKTLDSINNITYDTTIQSDNTPYFIGDFNSTIEILNEETPLENIYPDSEFTFKRKAALDFDLNSYPLRTSVKIFYIENDTLKNLCSGSMISEKHVLSAAHCFSEINTNNLAFDSILVCPVYNNGNSSSNFGCIDATKVFIIKDWEIGSEDFAILELKEPIGQSTGWIGIGYDETGEAFEEDNFYKFTYPNIFIPSVDSLPYNGDTLYYNYGKVNVISPNTISTINTNGIVGESGSSMIRMKNNERYTSYGVLTFGFGLRHSKITREMFHLLKNVIQDGLTSTNIDLKDESNILIFPNPVKSSFQIKNLPDYEFVNIVIFDLLGRIVLHKSNHQSTQAIDLSSLDYGQYFITVEIDQSIFVEKIVKAGH